MTDAAPTNPNTGDTDQESQVAADGGEVEPAGVTNVGPLELSENMTKPDDDTPTVESVVTQGSSVEAIDRIEVTVEYVATRDHGCPTTATVEFVVDDRVAELHDIDGEGLLADQVAAITRATTAVDGHHAVHRVVGLEELRTNAHSESA